MLVATSTVALAAPPIALLALHAPAVAIAPFAALGGAGLTLLNALWETTLQKEVPPEALSRVSSYDWLGSVGLQPIGFAVTGVLAAGVLGVDGMLWLACGVALASSAAIACVPSVRGLRVR